MCQVPGAPPDITSGAPPDNNRGGPSNESPASVYPLEVDRDVESRKPWSEDRGRPSPDNVRRVDVVDLLVGGPRVGVQQVVEIEADVGRGAAKAEHFRDPQIDRFDAIWIYLPGQREINGLEREPGRERTPQVRRLQNRAVDVVIGRQRCTVGRDERVDSRGLHAGC